MSILARLLSLFKRDGRFQPIDTTRMDPRFIADLKAEAERNAGDPYPRPAPDYCDVAYGEQGNPRLTVRQRASLRTVK